MQINCNDNNAIIQYWNCEYILQYNNVFKTEIITASIIIKCIKIHYNNIKVRCIHIF